MYYVYVLKSLFTNHYYVGQTNNLEERLKTHNNGESKYTKSYKPWKIHYFETVPNKSEAVKRERYFKTHAGRNWLKKRVDKRV